MEGGGGHIGWVAAFDSQAVKRGISLPPCARTRPGFRFQPLTTWQRQKGVSLGQLPPDSVLCDPLPAINCAPASKVYFFSTWVYIVRPAIKLARKGQSTLADGDFLWL